MACVRKTDWIVIKERVRERRIRTRASIDENRMKKAPLEKFKSSIQNGEFLSLPIDLSATKLMSPLNSRSRRPEPAPFCPCDGAIYLAYHLLSYAFLSGMLLNGTSAVWIVFVREKSLSISTAQPCVAKMHAETFRSTCLLIVKRRVNCQRRERRRELSLPHLRY